MHRRRGRSFTARRSYPQQPQDIWDIITAQEFVLESWVRTLVGPTAVHVGFSLAVETEAIPGTAFSGHFDCEFIEVRPSERLTFQLTSISDKPQTFHCSLNLSPQGRETHLSLTLSGFASHPLDHVPVHDMLENALEQLAGPPRR